MSVRVHPANIHDSVGAKEALESMRYKFPGLRRILADGGYRGETVRNTVRRLLRCDLKVVLRSDKRTKPKVYQIRGKLVHLPEKNRQGMLPESL